jgi:hypothetical protein
VTSRLLAFEDHAYVIGCGSFVIDGCDCHELPTLCAEKVEVTFFGRVDTVVFGPNIDDPVLPADRFHHATPRPQRISTRTGFEIRVWVELSRVAGAESVASTSCREFVKLGGKELVEVG